MTPHERGRGTDRPFAVRLREGDPEAWALVYDYAVPAWVRALAHKFHIDPTHEKVVSSAQSVCRAAFFQMCKEDGTQVVRTVETLDEFIAWGCICAGRSLLRRLEAPNTSVVSLEDAPADDTALRMKDQLGKSATEILDLVTCQLTHAEDKVIWEKLMQGSSLEGIAKQIGTTRYYVKDRIQEIVAKAREIIEGADQG